MNDLPASLIVADANTLPYQITDVATGTKMSASFERLTKNDAQELQSGLWAGARFRDVWLALLDEEHTFKLVARHDSEQRIQGIVRLGEIKRDPIVGLTLRNNLLETAPFNRQQALARMYSGVGKALVARMIIESFHQGAMGQLLIKPVSGSLAFYQHLGFRQVGAIAYYNLSAVDARSWLHRYFGV